MNLALSEDGSLPGEPLPFLDAVIWFFVLPVSIFLIVWLLVVAGENMKKSKMRKAKPELLTQIPE
jgi:large-conductance mechanosensitive channel